jgi:hypothetical protein
MTYDKDRKREQIPITPAVTVYTNLYDNVFSGLSNCVLFAVEEQEKRNQLDTIVPWVFVDRRRLSRRAERDRRACGRHSRI